MMPTRYEESDPAGGTWVQAKRRGSLRSKSASSRTSGTYSAGTCSPAQNLMMRQERISRKWRSELRVAGSCEDVVRLGAYGLGHVVRHAPGSPTPIEVDVTEAVEDLEITGDVRHAGGEDDEIGLGEGRGQRVPRPGSHRAKKNSCALPYR